jgi:hypothetical protein
MFNIQINNHDNINDESSEDTQEENQEDTQEDIQEDTQEDAQEENILEENQEENILEENLELSEIEEEEIHPDILQLVFAKNLEKKDNDLVITEKENSKKIKSNEKKNNEKKNTNLSLHNFYNLNQPKQNKNFTRQFNPRLPPFYIKK